MSRQSQFSREILNRMQIKLPALSINEAMARAAVAAFVSQLDPGVTEIADIKCAVSEAVTNAVVHAYRDRREGSAADEQSQSGDTFDDSRATVYILTTLYDDRSAKIIIRDRGCGIPDIRRAMEPLYTTDETGERSGMGFAIMQSFMDTVKVKSAAGRGTTVELRKKFAPIGAGASVQSRAAESGTPTAEAEDGTGAAGQEDIA